MKTERDMNDHNQGVSPAEKTAKCLPDVAELPQVLPKKPKYGEDETNFLFSWPSRNFHFKQLYPSTFVWCFNKIRTPFASTCI